MIVVKGLAYKQRSKVRQTPGAAEAIGHGEDCVAHVLDDLHSMLETLPCAG